MPKRFVLHDLLEAVVRPVGVRTADAAVRDERVERAARLGGRGERRRDAVAVGDVAEVGAAADALRHLLERVEVRGEQREQRPLGRESLGDRLPDPLPAAGDDDVPALE